MPKITLPDVMSGYNLSAINSNFQKIEDELNNKVLYRQVQDGEPNAMSENLDMNSNDILNAGVVSTGRLFIAGQEAIPAQLANEAALTALNLYKAELLSNAGAGLIGTSGGVSVQQFINNTQQQLGDRLIVRPTGTPAGDKAALLAAEAAAAGTGMVVHTLKGDVFTIDNSTGPGITFTSDDFKLTGLGRIKATHDNNDLVVTTGDRAKVRDGLQLEGPGTWRPDLGGTGNPPALLKMTGDDSDTEGLLFIEPYCAGLSIRGAAGGMDKKNTILCSYAGTIAQPFIFGTYYYVVSDRIQTGSIIDGCIQGICGGGDGSGTLTVTSKDGVVTSSLRNIIVTMCTPVNQLDHSIYFSNNTSDISILNCVGLKSVNCPIKIAEGPNLVSGCTGAGGTCIQGRNLYSTRITGCRMRSTLNSETAAYAIVLFEQTFKQGLTDVEIDHCSFTHEGGASQGGIYVEAPVWTDQSYQSVIDGLYIHHNRLRGYGNAPGGFQISVVQKLFATNPVTGSLGLSVHIHDNDGEFPTHSHSDTVGLFLGYGIGSGSACRNRFKGFRSVGIRKLGVQNFNTRENELEPASGVTALAGVLERAKDTTLHVNSQSNSYGDNKFIGSFSREVTHSDETCTNDDRRLIRRTGSLSSDSVIASQWPKQVVYNNHTAGASITLDALTTSPWPINSDLTITNAGAANSLTVNPGGFVVTAGTSLRLVGIGSNAWIKAN